MGDTQEDIDKKSSGAAAALSEAIVKTDQVTPAPDPSSRVKIEIKEKIQTGTVVSSAELNKRVMDTLLNKTEISSALEKAGIPPEEAKAFLDQAIAMQQDMTINAAAERLLLELIKDIHIQLFSKKRFLKHYQEFYVNPLKEQGLL